MFWVFPDSVKSARLAKQQEGVCLNQVCYHQSFCILQYQYPQYPHQYTEISESQQ